MSHPLHRRPAIVLPAAILLAGLAVASCGHKQSTEGDGAGSPNASGANDQKIVDLMEKMRARALKNPGGAMEASDFAYNVTQLYTQGVTQRRSIDPTLVDEAVKCLDDARLAKPEDAADLLARKGEMLLAAERKEGVGALRLSIAERPNLRAFKPLIKHYETQKMVPEAEALCKRTLPAMTNDQNRYAVLDECLKVSGAATPEAGLKWAGTKEISFYKNRKKDLDARVAAAAKAKAKEEAAAEPKK
jgi:hypothetical protein